MLLTAPNIFIFLVFYPLAFFLMVDSGTDFAFRRPQKLLSWQQREWLEFEGNVLWLLLARFLTGFLLLLCFGSFSLQLLLMLGLASLEILAGRIYLGKVKR